MPSGTTVHQVFRPDGDRSFNVLTNNAYISRQAYLRYAQDGDTDVIYVKDGLYSPESVSKSDNVSESTSGKTTTYTHTSNKGDILYYNGSGHNINTTYQIIYTVSTGPTTSTTKQLYSVNEKTGTFSAFGTPPYYYGGNGYVKSRVTLNGKDISGESLPDFGSGSCTFTITPRSSTGTVSVTASTAPTYTGKTLVPATLTQAATTAKKYRYMTYVQSSGGSTGTATVLAKTGTAAVQTFAFEMDDDDLYDE